MRGRWFARGVPAWAWPLLAVPVVAMAGAWTYRAIADVVESQLVASLRANAAAGASSLGLWLDAQADAAEIMAADPRVLDAINAQIEVARRTAGDPAALRASPDLRALRDLLGPVVNRHGEAGFFVLDGGGLIVARLVDERIGDRVSLAVADGASRALAGTRVFLPPTTEQRFSKEPMAFILVPVKDAGGSVRAVLAVRIPGGRVATALAASPLGDSGDTYVVDTHGRMVSNSRFASEVVQLGLLPGSRDTTAALEVRDPGAALVPGMELPSPPGTWPLTWAAAEVVAGRTGVHVGGYRDFRGVEVVGAWHRLPAWDVGVVTELRLEEAYAPLRVVRRAFLGLGAALLVAAAVMAAASRRMYRLQKDAARAQRLGQYTLEEKIGQGGMGAVYRARHALLRRPTAVKLVRQGLEDPLMYARFEREVQLTSQLTHPNTIAIYDYGRTDEGVFYYAMEYLPGLPLETVIREDGAQDPARVVHLVEQICGSLAEAHREGIVHRDVKPANVMLCERGGTCDIVKMLDFGLVKDTGSGDASLTETSHVVGTPQYMSPEAARAAHLVDARSDVYAVGAIAYALLTGTPVFAGSSGVDVISQHLHSVPESPSVRLGRTVDADLETLVLACLAKNPDDRPADAGELLSRLENWPGKPWAQAQARAWWQTRGAVLLEARQAEAARVSRESARLDVDVAGRVKSGSRSD
jgi:tRNA A-37 threonylcarbamoyl transferase component Bud32